MCKIQPIRVAYQKQGNLKFCALFKIKIQKREGLSNFEKPVFDFSVLYPKKSGLSKKLKVSTLDIRDYKYPILKFPAQLKVSRGLKVLKN